MRKIVIALLSAFMLVSGTVYADGYDDVAEDAWYYDAVYNATEKGWFSGYTDNTFRPEESIARSEAIKVLFTYKYNDNVPQAKEKHYKDIEDSAWYANYANLNGDEDIIPVTKTSQGNKFNPVEPITRQDTMVGMVNILGYSNEEPDMTLLDAFSDSDKIAETAKPYLAIALKHGLISGFTDGTIGANKTITRAQFATILMNASSENKDEPGEDIPAVNGGNLFDEKYTAAKTLKPDTGEVQGNGNFYLSDFIPVEGGAKYFASTYNPNTFSYVNNCKNYAFYDSDKKYISGAASAMNTIVTSPENAAYIRFSIQKISGISEKRVIKHTMLMKTDKAPSSFYRNEAKTENALTTLFKGKNVCIYGDNFVSNGENWINLVEDKIAPNAVSIKGSGARRYSSLTSDYMASDKNLSSLPENMDYLIVACGMYDWMVNTTMGDDNSVDSTYFRPGVMEFASKIQKKFPDTKIIFLTIPKVSYAGSGFEEYGQLNTKALTTEDYSEAVKDAAEENGFDVIDICNLWGRDDFSSYLKFANNSYLYANDEGAEKLADAIASKMIEIAEK